MTIIHAAQALTPQGWRRNGRIAMIETDIAPQAGDELHAILVPAMANVHSHAFQRGMAGLAELRGLLRGRFLELARGDVPLRVVDDGAGGRRPDPYPHRRGERGAGLSGLVRIAPGAMVAGSRHLDGPPVSDSRHTWTGPRRHAPADFVSPDGQHPALACKQEDALLDAWIFSGGNGVVDCVWVAGEKVVTAGRHRRHEESGRRFFRAMRQLCD